MNFIDPQIGKPRCSTKKKTKTQKNYTVIEKTVKSIYMQQANKSKMRKRQSALDCLVTYESPQWSVQFREATMAAMSPWWRESALLISFYGLFPVKLTSKMDLLVR